MPRKPGAWVIETKDAVIIESSEIKALRLAASQGGTATYVPYGWSLDMAKNEPDENVPELKPKTKTKPAAEPESDQNSDADQSSEF